MDGEFGKKARHKKFKFKKRAGPLEHLAPFISPFLRHHWSTAQEPSGVLCQGHLQINSRSAQFREPIPKGILHCPSSFQRNAPAATTTTSAAAVPVATAASTSHNPALLFCSRCVSFRRGCCVRSEEQSALAAVARFQASLDGQGLRGGARELAHRAHVQAAGKQGGGKPSEVAGSKQWC